MDDFQIPNEESTASGPPSALNGALHLLRKESFLHVWGLMSNFLVKDVCTVFFHTTIYQEIQQNIYMKRIIIEGSKILLDIDLKIILFGTLKIMSNVAKNISIF